MKSKRTDSTYRTYTASIQALHAKTISFSQFHTASKPYWTGLARQLMRRWVSPIAVELADVEQQLMLAAWSVVDSFDSTRSPDLARYVTYNAMYHAKRWIHAQRGALRRSDRSPSRHPVILKDPDNLGLMVEQSSQQEEVALTHHEILVAAARAYTEPNDQLIFETVVAAHSTTIAADHLYSQAEVRLALQLDSQKHARRHVMAVAQRIHAAM